MSKSGPVKVQAESGQYAEAGGEGHQRIPLVRFSLPATDRVDTDLAFAEDVWMTCSGRWESDRGSCLFHRRKRGVAFQL
jgi:hypothetical protein